MAANWTPAEKKVLEACRETLDSILLRFKTDGLQYDQVKFDRAIGQMWAALLTGPEDRLRGVANLVPIWREAYHYLVNAYFRLYFDRKPGRPTLLEEQACRELMAMKKKMSYAKIGQILKVDKETIRKRVKTCEKRLIEGGKNPRE